MAPEDDPGDLRRRSLDLDRMAKEAAGEKDWRRARELWQEAMAIDASLGDERARAVTLVNVATITAQLGDTQTATTMWNEALDVLERIGDLQSQIAVLKEMAGHAIDARQWGYALGLHRRALEIAERRGDVRAQSLVLERMGQAALQEGQPSAAREHWLRARALLQTLGDVRGAAVVLGSLASCAEGLGQVEEAVELWQQALVVLDDCGDDPSRAALLGALGMVAAEQGDLVQAMGRWQEQLSLQDKLGDAEGRAATQRRMALPLTAKRTSAKAKSRPPSRASRLSLSEYDVAPWSAPSFRVGELWASLHGHGFHLRGVGSDAIGLLPSGDAGVAPDAKLASGLPFDPDDVAADLVGSLSGRSAQDAQALLAGYARFGYEALDLRQAGFTDTVLDRLEVPEPRPRPTAATLDVASLLAGLGAELKVVAAHPILGLAERGESPDIWKTSPREAFLLILSLMVAGVDCRPLFERDATRFRFLAKSPLYRLLWANPAPWKDVEDLVKRFPGTELAIGLAHALRNERYPEPMEAGHVLPWVRKILLEGPADQAMELGDILTDGAARCARLVGKEAPESFMSEALAQSGIIVLEYTGRGQRSDEGRLMALTKSLLSCPWYPQPFAPWPTLRHLGTWNSWLITYRELASKSFAEQERGGAPMLRSAALRGIGVARRQLPLTFRAACSPDPEIAANALPLLRLCVKSYATLLHTLWRSASAEKAARGVSGWLTFFEGEPASGHLAHETKWAVEFLAAASQEGFSLDVARGFLRTGAPFYAEDREGAVVPTVSDFS